MGAVASVTSVTIGRLGGGLAVVMGSLTGLGRRTVSLTSEPVTRGFPVGWGRGSPPVTSGSFEWMGCRADGETFWTSQAVVVVGVAPLDATAFEVGGRTQARRGKMRRRTGRPFRG